jgi:transmembrane sensor
MTIGMDDFKIIDKVVKLLIAKRDRQLSTQEQKFLQEWLEEDSGNKTLYEALTDDSKIPEKIRILSEYDKKAAFLEFKKLTAKNKIRRIYLNVLKYAAILIPFVFATWLILRQNKNTITEIQTAKSEITAGSSKAILKLADGRVVNLEEDKDTIAELDGTIVRNSSKEIVYDAVHSRRRNNIQYNEIEIPRGGEYQLTLSDGTKVWLNSETTIKYPVAFPKTSREVYLLNGEAFFDVTENKNSPFIVHTAKMDVNVFGTSFNVRAYSDEKELTTTLVTGKVLIREEESKAEHILTPNEQASLTGSEMNIKKVDVNRYIAWKNGRILFEANTLEEIFNDLGRWYDIKVDFEDPATRDLRFSIDVERYDNLSEILEILELTQKVTFSINEETLMIR